MRTSLLYFFVFLILFIDPKIVFAQSRAIHEIDSVMDLSPYYLSTHYAHLKSIEFDPLKFMPVDTDMLVSHLFDPQLKTENIYQNLGTLGQAHQPIIFDYQREMGFLLQTLPYPFFLKKQSDLIFFKLKTTYAKVAYAFGFPKENKATAEFAQYRKGVTIVAHLSAYFNRGDFVNQTDNNVCGDFLIHYENPSSIYGIRASYIINYLENSENGGLTDINQYQNNVATQYLKVSSPKANSKITTHDFAFQSYLNMKKKNKKYFGTITYDFQLGHHTLRYNDQFDTIYPHYEIYNSYHVTNDSTRIISAKNAIQWSNFSPYQEMSTKKNFFHIAGGLMHDYTELRFLNTPFTALYVFARTHIHLFDIMDITGQVSYSFLSDYGNNDLTAKAGISWSINKEKMHTIGVYANYYRNDPEYMMQHVMTNNFRWINSFSEQNILQLKALWNYQKYNISVSYYYLNNYVYLSESLRPEQNENNGNLIQVSAFIPFRYKNFGTTGNLNFQYCTNEVTQVPLFAGKLSVFYIFELLKKKLKIQVGTDLMYNTTYYADAYLPVLHKFYYQQTFPVGNFIFWNANVTFKIERINFFFRIGNLLAPMMGYRNFTTPNYPAKDFMIDLGINWRFHD